MTVIKIDFPWDGSVDVRYDELARSIVLEFRGRYDRAAGRETTQASIAIKAFDADDLRTLANAFESAASLLGEAAEHSECR